MDELWPNGTSSKKVGRIFLWAGCGLQSLAAKHFQHCLKCASGSVETQEFLLQIDLEVFGNRRSLDQVSAGHLAWTWSPDSKKSQRPSEPQIPLPRG